MLIVCAFLFCYIAVRAAVFCFREDVQALNPEVCPVENLNLLLEFLDIILSIRQACYDFGYDVMDM